MLRFILIPALVVAFTFIAYSQQHPYTWTIKKAGDASTYPGYGSITIFDSTLVNVEETGLSQVNRKQLIKILTESGAKEKSLLMLDYDPQSAFVEFKKIEIIKQSGKIKRLDVNKVLDYPAPARMIYWGARKKMLEIGRLAPGDAIFIETFRKGFTYALLKENNDKYIPPMKGNFYDIVEFWDKNPIKIKSYVANYPKSKKLQYKFYNGYALIKETEGEKTKTLSVSIKNQFPIKREPHMVALSDIAPKLLVSTSKNWEAKSIWFYNVNEDFGSFEVSKEIQKKVDKLLHNTNDENEKIKILTHWVADNIRYSGLSMGEGEGFTLHKGQMTFNDRCGVCKDKAGLLITMLRAAGFKSYAAMTMAGSRIDSIVADQFNHCVTVVELSNGKMQLLDPTWVPFVRELWSSAEQQQNYLIGLPNGSGLMETSISRPEKHYLKISSQSNLNENGSIDGTMSITAEGQSDASIRRMFTYYLKSQWGHMIRKELMAISPEIKIDSLRISSPYQYLDKPISIEIKYSIPNYALVAGNKIFFTPPSTAQFFKKAQYHLYFDGKMLNRKYPFRDRCSRIVEIRETITLPSGFKVEKTPSHLSGEGKCAAYDLQYSFDSSKLELKENILFKKRIYKALEWEEYRQAVNAQKEYSTEFVTLSKTE